VRFSVAAGGLGTDNFRGGPARWETLLALQQSEHARRPLPLDPPRLVAIDVDGTLLRSDSSLSPATIEAVMQAQQHDIRVVLASARPPRGIRDLCRQLNLTSYQINHNGALIYDPVAHSVVGHRALAGAVARAVLEVARRVDPSVDLGVEIVEKLYTEQGARRLRGHPATGASAPPVSSLYSLLDQPVTKILILGEAGALGQIQMYLAEKMARHVALAFSHQYLLQVVAVGVDKATALGRVAKHYGLVADQVVAIGDAPNDIPMMRWAGLSVAVANAWTDVRQAADFIVPGNDQDGVAVAIAKHVLANPPSA